MNNVYARPVRDLRNNYSELAEMVKNRDQVIITNNGREEAVLIGIEDYNAYRDLLHRQYILEELKKSEAEAKDPNNWLTEEEFWDGIDRSTNV